MTRRRPRSPGVLYGVLVIALLLVVAMLALTQNQPPPPTIAEFAPQSLENISDAPSDQSSSSGTGKGDCAAGQACGLGDGAGAAATPEPINVPKVRRCVGDPPRQIEDPQSPPCVPYWTGDNGGATARGVTRDEVRIATVGVEWGDVKSRSDEALEAFFNRRFEFYGRRIRLFQINTPAGNDNTAERARADAVVADEEIGAFAATTYRGITTDTIYYEELARRHIISATFMPSTTPNSSFEHADPYMWSAMPPLDDMERQLADWACRGLAGRAPRYSPDGRRNAVTGQQRTFGIVWGSLTQRPPATGALRDALTKCGHAPAAEAQFDGYDRATIPPAIVKMRDAGVSTVFCLCEAGATGEFMSGSSGQGFYPEWFVSTFYGADWELHARVLYPKDQAQSVYGISFQNRFHALADEPFSWAIRETDPSWSLGVDNESYLGLRASYSGLLLVASGVQMAGPRLTPETFRDGLRRARFPNPGAGGPPYYQARVQFGAGDHALNDDGTIIWYSTTAPSFDGSVGRMCYRGGGLRHGLGAYPATDDQIFESACP